MRRLTLRTRLLLIGLVGLVVATAVGALLLYALLWFTGVHSLDRDAESTAEQVASLVQAHQLPEPIPVTGSQIVQVLDGRDRVVSASVNGDRLTALLRPGELRRAESAPLEVAGARMGLDGDLRVTVTRVTGTEETVLVAQRLDDLRSSAARLRNALLVSFPLLVVALALVAWRVIGAALRPVEELRAGAERISGSGRDERLPVPASADEVRALAVTLNSMLDRLAESRERQRSFVGDVAHELRSPLTSIRAQLEIAQHLGEGGPLLDDLHAEVLRMSSMVEDLLTLAQLDADTAPLPPASRVDVGAVLTEVAARYAGDRVAPTVVEAGARLVATTDTDELRRVVENVVGNAVRHAAKQVRLSAERSGSRLIVRVDDDGPGIAEADRTRVLERFTRLDEARDRDAGGSGLGLAIVSELVRRRGGTLRLGSSPLGGLRVEVSIPRASS